MISSLILKALPITSTLHNVFLHDTFTVVGRILFTSFLIISFSLLRPFQISSCCFCVVRCALVSDLQLLLSSNCLSCTNYLRVMLIIFFDIILFLKSIFLCLIFVIMPICRYWRSPNLWHTLDILQKTNRLTVDSPWNLESKQTMSSVIMKQEKEKTAG